LTAERIEPAPSPVPEALRGFLDRLGGVAGPGGLALPGGLVLPGAAKAPESPLPEGAAFLRGSFASEAGSRAWRLYVPASRRADAPAPLVVMLHGCTQSPEDFALGTGMNALAEEHGCLVLYPAQPASANPSRCWNWFNPVDQERGQGEPSLIAGMTREVMREHAVDPARVYVAGLSAGAAAAVVMGTAYPDLYAAVGVHSGLPHGAARDMPSAFAAMRDGGTAADRRRGGAAGRPGGQRPVPTIVFHGDGDTTVHPLNGERVVAQARARAEAAGGLRTEVERGRVPGGHAWSRTLHRDAAGRALLEQWLVHGAGHAWSGGSPAGSYTDPKGPDASREMLRFFQEHPHPAGGQEGGSG
ncbi:MAG TPA: PHB depolymerase family esterase, partial [Geminicoccaceae bacterium]|nr:PHB depolymerase family esterase [Geminicoccaceae bacterium]